VKMNSARQQKHANGAFGSPILIPISGIDLLLQHATDNHRPLNPQQLITPMPHADRFARKPAEVIHSPGVVRLDRLRDGLFRR
jgi:hypothetical protein